MQRQRKQGHAAWEKYRDSVQIYRDGVRKAKAQVELNLAKDAKNIRGFHRYINQKKKTKETVHPMVIKMGELVTTGMEKADVLNIFFASFFTGNHSSHFSQVPKPQGREWEEQTPSHCR